MPGCLLPVGVRPESVEAYCDKHAGSRGNPAELDKFLQAYAVERARIKARHASNSVSRRFPNGSIRRTVQIGVTLESNHINHE